MSSTRRRRSPQGCWTRFCWPLSRTQHGARAASGSPGAIRLACTPIRSRHCGVFRANTRTPLSCCRRLARKHPYIHLERDADGRITGDPAAARRGRDAGGRRERHGIVLAVARRLLRLAAAFRGSRQAAPPRHASAIFCRSSRGSPSAGHRVSRFRARTKWRPSASTRQTTAGASSSYLAERDRS